MKNKRIIVLLVCIFSCFIPLFSADSKFYSDFENGWCGYSRADYIGTTRNVNPSQFAAEAERRVKSFFRITRYCEKLSRQENFLLWSALGEYDYKDNEVYSVVIEQDKETLNLIVVINDNGNNCSWYGGAYWIYKFN